MKIPYFLALLVILEGCQSRSDNTLKSFDKINDSLKTSNRRLLAKNRWFMDTCAGTMTLIKKAADAKIAFEKAAFFHDKKENIYKLQYAALVKAIKQLDKLEGRKACLQQMITDDSIASKETYVPFTYLPPWSNVVPPCSVLTYPQFLQIMLVNLEEKNNDSTLICDPELVRGLK